MREFTPEDLGIDPELCTPIPTNKDEWVEQRKWPNGYCGASDLKKLWGASQYGGKFSVWCEKNGTIDGDEGLPSFVKDAAEFGTHCESFLLEQGAKRLEPKGWTVGTFPYTIRHPAHRFAGVNLDGVAIHRQQRKIAVGECKVAKARDISSYEDAVRGVVNLVPSDNKIGGYWLQLQQAMGILLAASSFDSVTSFWWVVADNQFEQYGPIPFNPDTFTHALSLINEMEYRLKYGLPPESSFLDERVVNLMGHTDGAEWAGTVDCQSFLPEAKRYQQINAELLALKKEKEHLKRLLAGATLGHERIDFSEGYTGKFIFLKPKFDYSRWAKENPEEAKLYQTKPGYYWKLHPPKKEKS